MQVSVGRLDWPYSLCITDLQDQKDKDAFQELYGTNYSTQVLFYIIDLTIINKFIIVKSMFYTQYLHIDLVFLTVSTAYNLANPIIQRKYQTKYHFIMVLESCKTLVTFFC